MSEIGAEFENGQLDIYDDYSARWLSTTRMDLNAAQVEAQNFGKLMRHI
jgi:hypothetical protein